MQDNSHQQHHGSTTPDGAVAGPRATGSAGNDQSLTTPRRLAILEVIQDLVRLATDEKTYPAFLDHACARLVEHGHYAGAWIVRTDEGATPQEVGCSGLDDTAGALRSHLEQNTWPPCARAALQADEVVVIHDLQEACRACPLAANHHDRFGLSSRLVYRGQCYGVVTAIPGVARGSVDTERELMADVVEVLAWALHMHRTEARQRTAINSLQQSDAGHRRAFERAAIGLCHTTPDGRILTANPRFCDMVGRRLETLKGMSFAEFTHPDDVDLGYRVIRELVDGLRDIAEFEKRYLRPDGAAVWCMLRVGVVRHADGTPDYFITVAEDITPRRKAELVRNRLAAIVEGSTDAILSKDLDGIVRSWNHGAETLYGFPARDAIGRSIDMIIPDDRRDEAARLMAMLRRGEKVDRLETVRRRRDGSMVEVSLTMSPIRDARGRVTGVSSIGRDITRRKQDEARLEQLTRELQRSNRDLEQFAFVASHDLKEPLRMVTGFVDILKRDYAEALDERGRECLGFVEDGGRRMEQLITDLLAFSRIRGDIDSVAPVDLEEVVDYVLETLGPTLRQRSADIRRDDLPTVYGDAGQLERLYQNLLVNALAFGRDDHPVVHLGAERHDDTWQLWVEDNGPGVPPERAEKIFDLFERFDSKGTGLGLAICRRIVERHGGTIAVTEARHLGGARFCFTLPADPRRGDGDPRGRNLERCAT